MWSGNCTALTNDCCLRNLVGSEMYVFGPTVRESWVCRAAVTNSRVHQTPLDALNLSLYYDLTVLWWVENTARTGK
jgi:hypothetical protein